MDVVLIRLTGGAGSGPGLRSPEILVDILWASSIPEDRLEHIRARHGPEPGVVDLAMFFRIGDTPAVETALRLCHRAITSAPALSGWAAEAIDHPPDFITEQWRRSCIEPFGST